ncbi:hypothetical protein PV04_05611 [Phialophora macrospora]|uniref:Uncharacterized protein n=1 Tax=Phialophora macrospora TaxID=1851006 RepID=A0A0D2FNC1_9EURO|nr:hypothetical protein PV04_05611 [Phialophora macrospora]
MTDNNHNNHCQAQRSAQIESEDIPDDFAALNRAVHVSNSEQQTFPPTHNSLPQGHIARDNLPTDPLLENNTSNPQTSDCPVLPPLTDDFLFTDYLLDIPTFENNETPTSPQLFGTHTYNPQDQTAAGLASSASLIHTNTPVAPAGRQNEVSENRLGTFDLQFNSLAFSGSQAYHTSASDLAGNRQHAPQPTQSAQPSLTASQPQSLFDQGARLQTSNRRTPTSSLDLDSTLAPSHPPQPNMARTQAYVRIIQSFAIDRTLRDLERQPRMNYQQVYRNLVRYYVELVINENVPHYWISRLDLEVELAQVIIVATRSPEQYTREHLATLQELGDSMRTHRARDYRYIWFAEMAQAGITLEDVTVVYEDTDEYERLTGFRDWVHQWVHGTLDEGTLGVNGPAAPATSSNNAGGQASQGPWADVTVSHGHPRVTPSVPNPSQPSAAGGNAMHPLSGTRPPASNSLPSASNGGRASSSSRHASAARPATGNAVANPLTVRVNNGRTTFATNMGGGLVDFAEHQRGLRCPWTCLLGDSYVTNERGQLTGHLQRHHHMDAANLAHMLVDNPNASNFEGHDNKECFAWGQYVHGDRLPWKCLLCANHKGMKEGRNTLGRHLRLLHGIRVVIPRVDERQVGRHHQPGTTAGGLARRLEAVERAEEQRAADAAAQGAAIKVGLRLNLTGTKRSALDAGLEEEEDEEEEGEEEENGEEE